MCNLFVFQASLLKNTKLTKAKLKNCWMKATRCPKPRIQETKTNKLVPDCHVLSSVKYTVKRALAYIYIQSWAKYLEPFSRFSFVTSETELVVYRNCMCEMPSDLKLGPSPSKKNYFYLLQWLPFKIDEKRFLFHLKNFFRSQDI